MVSRATATFLLHILYQLCIKLHSQVNVKVYINILYVDSDYLTQEIVSEGIYDAILNLK